MSYALRLVELSAASSTPRCPSNLTCDSTSSLRLYRWKHFRAGSTYCAANQDSGPIKQKDGAECEVLSPDAKICCNADTAGRLHTHIPSAFVARLLMEICSAVMLLSEFNRDVDMAKECRRACIKTKTHVLSTSHSHAAQRAKNLPSSSLIFQAFHLKSWRSKSVCTICLGALRRCSAFIAGWLLISLLLLHFPSSSVARHAAYA